MAATLVEFKTLRREARAACVTVLGFAMVSLPSNAAVISKPLRRLPPNALEAGLPAASTSVL